MFSVRSLKKCYKNQIFLSQHLWNYFWINIINIIGLATKPFRFFPLGDFSRLMLFFSIANFRPYMAFDSWRFIDYSVKKSFNFKNWFARFCSGDFELKDAPRSGRPTEVDDDKIKAMIENKVRSTTRKIAEKLNTSHTCVERDLRLVYVNKLDICVPHKLNEIQLTKRISICDSLLKRNEPDLFLKQIITGDEKWVV